MKQYWLLSIDCENFLNKKKSFIRSDRTSSDSYRVSSRTALLYTFQCGCTAEMRICRETGERLQNGPVPNAFFQLFDRPCKTVCIEHLNNLKTRNIENKIHQEAYLHQASTPRLFDKNSLTILARLQHSGFNIDSSETVYHNALDSIGGSTTES